MDSKKTLIKNADWIITMDQNKKRLRHADILIKGRQISAIGEGLSQEGVDEVIDAKGKVIIPGLVNTHLHTCQSLVRNVTGLIDVGLFDWLDVLFAITTEVTPEFVEASSTLAFADLLKSGCTTTNDMPFAFPTDKPFKNELVDMSIKAAKNIGMRFHANRGSMTLGSYEGYSYPDVLAEEDDDVLQDSERLFKTYHDNDRFSMCRIGVAPDWHGLDSTERVQVDSLALAMKYGGQYHSHLCETDGEIQVMVEKYGLKPIQYLEKLGLLGPDTYYAHCVKLTDDDIRILADTRTGVAHCPKSNMILSAGVARVPEMRQAGVNVGLAVDGAASNNDSNMITEMRVSYLLHRLLAEERGASMTCEDVLDMSTAAGARVLGRDDIGYLAEGMAADLVLMDWNQLQYTGAKYDPVTTIVTSGDARLVDTVMVNGEIVVSSGILTTLDEQDTMAWGDTVGREILTKASKHVVGLTKDLN
jgi:cytosine/adenosine deaminase-related metal-dependent hydrolase